MTAANVNRLRTTQLIEGVAVGQHLLLRSASSLTAAVFSSPRGFVLSGISPQQLLVFNSALPTAQNYGSLWAGKGMNSRTSFGFKLEGARFRLIVAPELAISTNTDWELFHFYAPPPPPGYSQYYFPYYTGRFSIDQPMRFGDRSIRRLDWGQTSAIWGLRALQVGISTENEWWGPGIRNAIVLSNNAPGFPHFVIRSAHPLKSRLGWTEFRWLVGGLTESAYFDTVSTNNTRSIAAFATTLQTRWDPNLTVGMARSVYSTATGWGQVPSRLFDIFARTHVDTRDTTRTQKDQLFTLFFRWVFPKDGFEAYGEWGRTELQPSLRDFLVAPNHTQAYTLGLQWLGGEWRGGAWRVQGEITQLEQSATFRDRRSGSWYSSERVLQGYTNRGEVLGASIGPGASSQWLAVDYLRPDWEIGVFGGRTRYNQDAHNNFPFPEYVKYCNMDVSIYPGIRGAKSGSFGSVAVDLSFQNRLTPFFQNGGGCPNNGDRLDIRNNTLSITLSPPFTSFRRGRTMAHR